MGFMPYAAVGLYYQMQYDKYAEDCKKRGEEPLSREEWDKKEAEKKQSPEEPYSDYMK